jgi:hypothetical protein
LVQERYERFRRMGVFLERAEAAAEDADAAACAAAGPPHYSPAIEPRSVENSVDPV